MLKCNGKPVPCGAPGVGVAKGGNIGDVLYKTGEDNYKTGWAPLPWQRGDNLLDNAYFLSVINQPGYTRWTAEAAPSSGAEAHTKYGMSYGNAFDRWKLWTDTTTANAYIDSNGMHVAGYNFLQRIDPERLRYGEKYTLSALIDNTLCVVTGEIASTSSVLSMPELLFSFSDGVWSADIRICGMEGEQIVKAAKLEVGDKQTLAHKEGDTWILNDAPPNRALELVKCQRYAIELVNQGQYGILGEGQAVNSTLAIVSIPTPVTMRSIPVLTFSGDFVLTSSGAIQSGTKITRIIPAGISANSVYVNVEVVSGLDPNKRYSLAYAWNTTESPESLFMSSDL